MNLEELEKILTKKNGSTKEFPFAKEAMVFKVMNKMFALVAWQEQLIRVTLKSLLKDAIGYREIYKCVTAGYYMNKKHWNTITLDGTMKDESYDLVVAKLTKRESIYLITALKQFF